MTHGPQDDEGIVTIVSAVLVLALLVTGFATAMHTYIPRWGVEAETDWDASVGSVLTEATRGVSGKVGTSVPVAAWIPPAPEPQSLDVPFIGRAAPVRPSGSVTFEPACGSVTFTHALANGTVVTDLASAPTGCLVLRGDSAYSSGFEYRVEHGGVLRIDGGDAVVLAGMPIDLVPSTMHPYEVAWTVLQLRGAPMTTSVSADGVGIDFAPGAWSVDPPADANAASAAMTLTTAYPAAWEQWLEARFGAADLADGSFEVACVPDCSVGADGLGTVRVDLEGPDSGAGLDLRLSLAYAASGVTLR